MGRRRIHAELRFLGYEVAELTVSKYTRRRSPRPSPTWRHFPEAHLNDIAIDFFVVPTLTFRLLFGFIILRHDRRKLVHINVTGHPTAAWTARQVVDAFPYDSTLGICSATATRSTARASRIESQVSESERSSSPRALPGKTPSLNVSSVPSVENA